MNTQTVARLILIPFTLLSVYAVYKDGYLGIFEHQIASPAGWQVLIDLVIACLLLLLWIVPHAKKTGRNPWPSVLVTLTAGSFGPLLYFAMGQADSFKSE